MKVPTTKTSIQRDEEPEFTFGQLRPGTFYKSMQGQTIYMKLESPITIIDVPNTGGGKFACNAIDVKPANSAHAAGSPFFHKDDLLVEIVKEVVFTL